MAWVERLPSGARRLAEIGVAEGDGDDLRLDKALLTLVTTLIVAMSFAWVGTYLLLGLPWSAAIPFGFQIYAVLVLGWFARTKQIGPPRAALIVMMTLLPFALQASLGGFENGSAVSAWSGIMPLLAALFGASSLPPLLAVVVLGAASAVAEPTLAASAPAIDPDVRAGMFVLNLAGPTLAAFLSFRYFVDQRNSARAALAEQHRLLELEQARSERLLLNVLPAPIADQLRSGATTIAESHPDVSVLFADLVGFTPLAERLPPAALVDLLNEVFVEIDDLVVEAGLEKIKTIGDAYMVVGGLPVFRPDHLEALLRLAVRMGEATATVPTPDGTPLQLRIGVDTGAVVAGVIGRRKFSYDVWGDTVNTASRMESHGLPGRIHVTERVARAAGHLFRFEPRDPVHVKGKGEMATYFLLGPIAEPAPDRSATPLADEV